ncbi:restriction endonuclease subunit S [Fructilactobacillus ixorae]|uniref:Restriction endonuclease subunit S n=1 Tax=Fructilactobacillus ixorae TaxID=1750535 RepID=A0ABY5C3H3_9LACO|nr:restriction endonuclease subunit S [Fructilactobacillus ixorae]USS92723.1 restriction endonuclease subunit S [Fructilactobacillus ixorae]
MIEKQDKPRIRFKNFTDAWQEQKLADMTVNLDSNRVPVTKNKRIAGSTPYYGANGIQDYVAGATHTGNLILIAEDGANSVRDYPVNTITGKAWVNNHSHVLTAKPGLSNYLFLGKRLKTININPYLTGSDRLKLTNHELNKIMLKVPQFAEQEKLGDLFETLDSLIVNRQRKYQKIQTLKRQLLQRLFPETPTTPSLRFTAFSHNWVTKKLSEVATIKSGGTPRITEAQFWNGKIDWFTPTEVQNQGYLHHSLKTITRAGLENSRAVLLPKDTILMTSRAGIGKMGILSYPATTNQGFQSLIPSNQINPYFLYSMHDYIARMANKLASGITFTEISARETANIKLVIPETTAEQAKIGDMLEQYDQFLSEFERELTQLKQVRTAFMQLLFS